MSEASAQAGPGARSAQVRLALWFALAIGSLGALHPFLARTLAQEGFGDRGVAAMLALFPAGFLSAGLLWGWLADRSARPLLWLRGAAVASAACAVAAAWTSSWPWLAGSLALLAVTRAPLIPLVDALTVATLGDAPERYGRVRLWGSVAFAVAVFSVGALLDLWPRAPLLVAAVLLVGTAAMTFALPAARIDGHLAGLQDLNAMRGRAGLTLLLVVATLQGVAHSSYDFLFSLHMDQRGAPTWHATLAFVGGLSVEVTLMALAPNLLRRMGPVRLLRLATLLSVPRFVITGLALPTLAIALVQTLHGITFGAFWLAAVALVAERAPPGLRNSAQAALMAASAGIGPLVLLLVASSVLATGMLPWLFVGAGCVSAVATLLAWQIPVTPTSR